MSYPLTPEQLLHLARMSSAALAASTLRDLSELRWLEHLGLVTVDPQGRFTITVDGQARLEAKAVDSL